jgi:hypothetical protein
MFKFLPLFVLSWLIISLPAISKPIKSSCPPDLETLTRVLLPQLPSYANRVIQRGRKLNRNYDFYSYVIVAGKPDFQPLNLSNQEYQNLYPEASEQLFFTTLERRYINNKPVETQNFHWVFLTHTKNGWRLVQAFSRFGSTNSDSLPSPPQDTTNSVIGESFRLLLRDCEHNSQ